MLFVGYGLDKGVKIQKEIDWKRCADLAIAWNCSSIARKSIFNNANYDHWRVSQEIIAGLPWIWISMDITMV